MCNWNVISRAVRLRTRSKSRNDNVTRDASSSQNTRVIDERTSTSRYHRNVISFRGIHDRIDSDRRSERIDQRCIAMKVILLSWTRTKERELGESTRNEGWRRVCWSSGLIAITSLSVRTRAKRKRKIKITSTVKTDLYFRFTW